MYNSILVSMKRNIWILGALYSQMTIFFGFTVHTIDFKKIQFILLLSRKTKNLPLAEVNTASKRHIAFFT